MSDEYEDDEYDEATVENVRACIRSALSAARAMQADPRPLVIERRHLALTITKLEEAEMWLERRE